MRLGSVYSDEDIAFTETVFTTNVWHLYSSERTNNLFDHSLVGQLREVKRDVTATCANPPSVCVDSRTTAKSLFTAQPHLGLSVDDLGPGKTTTSIESACDQVRILVNASQGFSRLGSLGVQVHCTDRCNLTEDFSAVRFHVAVTSSENAGSSEALSIYLQITCGVSTLGKPQRRMKRSLQR